MSAYTLCVLGLLLIPLHITSEDPASSYMKNIHEVTDLSHSHSLWLNFAKQIPTKQAVALLNQFFQLINHHNPNSNLKLYFGLCSGLLTRKKRQLFGRNRLTLFYLCVLLILLGNNTESNPGPVSSDLCGTCNLAVKWHPDRGVFCEDCNTWFHAECQGMSSFTYQYHCDHSNEPWQCTNCGVFHFNPTFFDHTKSMQSDHSLSHVSTDNSSVKYAIPRLWAASTLTL